MKLLCTIGFLLALGSGFYLGNKKHKRVYQGIRGKNTGVVTYVLSMAMLVIAFIQFWLLTGIFPFYVILLLVVSSLLGIMIHNLIGAIAGFSLQQKKINVLGVVWAVQHPLLGCALIISSVLMLMVMTIGSLYTFWKWQIGSGEARAWIAFFLFIVPQLVAVPTGLALNGPMVTSEFIDDDVRNSYVSSQFSSILYSTVTLVFPMWIFQTELSGVFGGLPPYGLLLSIPLLLFLLGGAFPFFVGMHRYRSTTQTLLEWRRNWLQDVNHLLTLPEGDNRHQLWKEKLSELEAEIRTRTDENEFLAYYQRLRQAGGAQPLVQADGASATTVPTATPTTPPPEPLQQIFQVIEQYQDKLRQWDVRFRDVDELTVLFRSLSGTEPSSVAKFVEGNLNDVKGEISSLTKRRNVVAGACLALFPALGSWFFRAYQEPISRLIGELTGLTK